MSLGTAGKRSSKVLPPLLILFTSLQPYNDPLKRLRSSPFLSVGFSTLDEHMDAARSTPRENPTTMQALLARSLTWILRMEQGSCGTGRHS